MKKIDYEKLKEIVVKSQEELDAIPLDYKGRICIEVDGYCNKVVIKNEYYMPVIARENSSVIARGNSLVRAFDDSSVKAFDDSSVKATSNVQVYEHRDGLNKPNIKISGNLEK